MKKTTLGIAGNDPFVVLKDANLEEAIQAAAIGRLRNNGLDCFAPRRIIVIDEHYDMFKEQLIEILKKVKYGDPMDPNTEMGPLKESNHLSLEEHMKSLPTSWRIIWERSI